MWVMNTDERDFCSVDLNLRVAFEVLLRERHVTHTAHVLGISQAAASAAPARLRRLFDDELFTLPRHAAVAFAEATGLTLSQPPISTPRFSVSMAWTPQRENDPAQQWLRGFIRHCLSP